MKRMRAAVAALAVAALVAFGAGCTDTEPKPEPTATATESASSKDDLTRAAFEIAWKDSTLEEQMSICFAFGFLDKEELIKEMKAEGDELNADLFYDLVVEECE